MDIEKLFGTTNLYKILQIDPKASINEVKKSYYHLARIHHPDKNSEVNKSAAVAKFHIIHQAYLILSNAESRKKYDEGDCNVLFAKATVSAEWENHLKISTEKSLIDASTSYKNSAVERANILRQFVEGKGSMVHIMNTVPFTRKDDEARIITIIRVAIENKEIPQYTIKKLPKGY